MRSINVFKRLPFNWRTPLGYLVAIFAQSAGTYAAIISGVTSIAFFICSCWLFVCIAKDITTDLPLLDCSKKSKPDDPTMKQRFCTIIQMYSDARQLSKSLNRQVLYHFYFIHFTIWLFIVLSTNIMRSTSTSLPHSFGGQFWQSVQP